MSRVVLPCVVLWVTSTFVFHCLHHGCDSLRVQMIECKLAAFLFLAVKGGMLSCQNVLNTIKKTLEIMCGFSEIFVLELNMFTDKIVAAFVYIWRCLFSLGYSTKCTASRGSVVYPTPQHQVGRCRQKVPDAVRGCRVGR